MGTKRNIYLDHSATTPIHPQVLSAMMPYLKDYFGNPSSVHSYGRITRNALNEARDRMAKRLGCDPSELVFTSGGTESDNMALFGTVYAQGSSRKHVITTEVEHHAVLGACHFLESMGFSITYLPVDSMGQVCIDDVKAAIKEDTVLISMIYGNNEIGTLQPIEDVGRLAREHNINFHVDAVQVLGMLEINLASLPVDLMSFSSHKINGPKGVGALYVSKGTLLQAFTLGGSQERNRRAGTENLAGIIGFSEALDIAYENISLKRNLMTTLRRTMIKSLGDQLGDHGFIINGHPCDHLPHILNVSFPSVDTATLLVNLDLEGIAAASGSACSSGSLETSHVLRAMNCSDEIMNSAVRFSFGLENTLEEVVEAAQITATIVKRIRNKRKL